MKTVHISQRAKSITALLNEPRSENLVLTLADGSEFILAEIDAFDHEVKLTRQNQPLMELLKQRAQQPKRVSLAEARKRSVSMVSLKQSAAKLPLVTAYSESCLSSTLYNFSSLLKVSQEGLEPGETGRNSFLNIMNFRDIQKLSQVRITDRV